MGIQGSPKSYFDLNRARVKTATAVFILPCKESDPKKADADVILTAIAVRNINPEVDIFASVIQTQSRDRLMWSIGVGQGDVLHMRAHGHG